MGSLAHDRWMVSEAELINIDAYRARELVIKCFMTAQREVFAMTKQQMGLPGDEDALERSVVGAVRVAFKRAGGDFDHPTKESLRGACASLAQTANAWGTPSELVCHHQQQIDRVLSRLRD